MQALEFRRTGKLPESFTTDVMVEQEEPKTPKESHSNGACTWTKPYSQLIECCCIIPFKPAMLESILTRSLFMYGGSRYHLTYYLIEVVL
jgi:hypothetical protein